MNTVADTAFPRLLVLEGLLHALRYQLKLTKEASSTLIDVGQAIFPNVTSEETTMLLQSTLYQEAHVRNASLQALQVRFLDALRTSTTLKHLTSRPSHLTSLIWIGRLSY